MGVETEEAGQMTRIVFLSHSAADSGAEQSVVSLLAKWPQSGPSPVFVLGQHGAIEERASASGVECEVVELDAQVAGTRRHERRPHRLGRAAVGLVRHASPVRDVIERRSADVVVAISVKALVFGWLAARRAKTTVVWSLNDRVDRGYFSSFLVPFLRYGVPRLVDGILVNSRSTLATIRPGQTPVMVATPSIELDGREFHGPGEEVKRVVMLGRLAPWKGQDLFLRAFAAAYAGSDAEAYIVGGALFGEDEYAASLRREAERLGIADRVHFVGHVQDPWAWLVDANVLAHCSRVPEPFGMVVVQGLWARCAVVATRPGGPEEIITDGLDGLLVPCDDEAAMTAALRRLRDDAALRRRLSEHGRVTALSYDASSIAPELSSWLTDLDARLVPRGSVRMGSASEVPSSG